MSDANRAWASSLVADIPRPWAAKLLNQWEKRRSSFNPAKATAENDAQRAANLAIRESVEALAPVSTSLPLDAVDNEVCNVAWAAAERCRVKRLAILEEQRRAPIMGARHALQAYGLTLVQIEALEVFEQRIELARICGTLGVDAPGKKYDDLPAVLRMVSAQWWRGQLRKLHAKAVETAAIRLGLVARGRECYVSNVSLEARRAQNERNAAALEATRAINLDTDQEFTLAELAAKGPANAAIKRAELMTRINGFERIAIAAGHTGLFVTITCPSKMHAFTTVYGRAIRNKNYDGTLPNEAQGYLTKVWARVRSALARGSKRGGRPPVTLYGFRIAEPQHDGTPHWHCMFFYPQQHDTIVRSTIRRYALEMDGDEPGAQARRVDFKTMDPALGTAAGYIAKYVAKNIDGYRLEKDLLGNDALETSARVEAWATRWRIRQFQQVGGPPVTVWRELRRVESVPADAPAYVRNAHNAVNKTAVFEGRDNASVSWKHYVEAQGGVTCGRRYRVRIAKAQSDKVGRYGETGTPQIVGIEYHEVAKVFDAIGNWIDVLPRTVTVESKRYEWEILKPRATRWKPSFDDKSFAAEGHEWARDLYAEGALASAPVGLDFGFERAQRASWTCVNNCTNPAADDAGSNESTSSINRDSIARRDRKAGGGSLYVDRRPK